VVELVAPGVLGDVHVVQPEFAFFTAAEGVVDLGLAGADGFDLGPPQGDASFEFFVYEIVTQRLGVADFGVAGLIVILGHTRRE